MKNNLNLVHQNNVILQIVLGHFKSLRVSTHHDIDFLPRILELSLDFHNQN